MQHRRGIDYVPMVSPSWHDAERVSPPQEVGVERPTDVVEWMQVGAVCGQCKRRGWIDAGWLRRKFGSRPLADLTPKLSCCHCKNAGPNSGNRWLIGKMPR